MTTPPEAPLFLVGLALQPGHSQWPPPHSSAVSGQCHSIMLMPRGLASGFAHNPTHEVNTTTFLRIYLPLVTAFV
jgi:hypothetical protein